MSPKTARADVTPIRQRTQFSCMAAAMSIALRAHGHECDEDTVNKVMGAQPMRGASWEDALACAQYFGMRATLTSPCTLTQLKAWTDAGVPVLIAWNPEGREWSHASLVFDVSDDGMVSVADPNIPDPEQTVRLVPKDEFYKKWFEKWPSYLVRRPAMAIEREITVDGRQVQAGKKELRSRKDQSMSRFLKNGPPVHQDVPDTAKALEKANWDARKELGRAGLPGAGMGAGLHKDKSQYNRKREKSLERDATLTQPLMTRRDYGVTAMLNTQNFERVLKMAEDLPGPVERYVKETMEGNPDYTEEQAWATAWSRYCKYKNPGSDHCQKDQDEYFKAAGESRVSVSALRTALKVALKGLRYTSRNISVRISPTYTMYWPGDDGARGVFQLVGKTPGPVIRGAFGGGALGAREQSAVDSDQSSKPLPEGSVAINGQEGSTVYLSLTAASMDDVLASPGKTAGMDRKAGYSQYWDFLENPTPVQWAGIVAGAKKVLQAAKQQGIVIRGGMGEGAPEIDAKEIWLNGDAATGMGHETFNLQRGGGGFCKTNGKPYDAVVVSILAIAKQIMGDKMTVSSDGGDGAIRRVLAKFPRGESMTVDEVAAVVGDEFREMNENPPPSVIKVREDMQSKTAMLDITAFAQALASDADKEGKFEKGVSVPVSDLPDELQDNVEDPPPAVQKLKEHMQKAASKGTDPVWVVRDPTEESEPSDILYKTTVDDLASLAIGTGVQTWKAEHTAIYFKEPEAEKDAKARMAKKTGKKAWSQAPALNSLTEYFLNGVPHNLGDALRYVTRATKDPDFAERVVEKVLVDSPDYGVDEVDGAQNLRWMINMTWMLLEKDRARANRASLASLSDYSEMLLDSKTAGASISAKMLNGLTDFFLNGYEHGTDGQAVEHVTKITGSPAFAKLMVKNFGQGDVLRGKGMLEGESDLRNLIQVTWTLVNKGRGKPLREAEEHGRMAMETFAEALKEGKFEEGKPADPTENMSKEDAAEWERQNEAHKDEFKGADGQSDAENAAIVSQFFHKAAETRTAGHGYMLSIGPHGEIMVDGVPDAPLAKMVLAKAMGYSPKDFLSSNEFSRDVMVHSTRMTWKSVLDVALAGSPEVVSQRGRGYYFDLSVGSIYEKSAGVAATGLYGFNKATEGACTAGVNKLQKAASKIAKALYAKDESSPAFLTKHAGKGSKTAGLLLKAMEGMGPLAGLGKTAGWNDRVGWRMWTGPVAVKQVAEALRSVAGVKNVVEGTENVLFDYSGNHPQDMLTDPDVPALVKAHLKGKGLFKTAGKSGSGLYGFSEKTAKLGLSACNDLHHEAGVIAGDLFARKGADPVKVAAYLASHAKKAKCPYAGLLAECAPDVNPVTASKKASDFLASGDGDDVDAEVADILAKC